MTHTQRLQQLLADGRLMRYRDLVAAGIPGFAIKRALAMKVIRRFPDDETALGYGLATAVRLVTGDADRMVAAVWRHPKAVLWGVSALKFHDIIDRDATALLTAAVPSGCNRASTDTELHISLWSNPAMFQVGVTRVAILWQPVPITDIWRTVIDAIRLAGTSLGWVSHEQAERALKTVVINGHGGVRGRDAVNRMADYCAALNYPRKVMRELETIARFSDDLRADVPAAAPGPRRR